MKKLLYIGFFCFSFVISFYLTFPLDAFRPYIEQQMQNALSGEAQNMHLTTAPKVDIGQLSLWWLSGVAIHQVKIQMGSETQEPGPQLEFEELKFRMGILSTLTGSPKVEFDSRVYAGRARGSFVLSQENALKNLWLDIKNIDLKKLRGPITGSELQIAGQLNLDADVNLGKNPAKDGQGNIEIDFKNLSIGPGVFELPGGMMGGLTLPLIKLGQFSGKLALNSGKATLQDLKLSGGDIEAHVNASSQLADNILLSPLKGSGWFRLKPEFQKANPKFAVVLDMSPDIKAAEDSEGRIHFTLIGSLMQPTPKWGKGS